MIAKDGRAIINGEVVPRAEVEVLKALTGFDTPVTVPQLTKVLKTKSVATVYSLMKRLHKNRKLVARTEVDYSVCGASVRRVVWEATEVAREFFYAP